MCVICDGTTVDQARLDLSNRKERFGWALQGVEASRPWVYTIGLLERFDHPELVMAGVPIRVAGSALNALGARIAGGERFPAGCSGVRVNEVEAVVGPVHHVHVAAGLVGRWEDHYRDHPAMLERLEVVQVLPVPTGRLPRLDRSYTTLSI